MSNLFDDIEQLSDEELKKVSNLIHKFAKRHDNDVDNPPRPTKIKHGKGRKNSRKIVAEDLYEPDDASPRSRGRGRSQPKHHQQEPHRRGQRPKNKRRAGGQGRIEPVQLSGENKFVKMRERNEHKKDTKIDKKLWGDSQPTERPEEFEFAEVQCRECKNYFDIHPDLVYYDKELKQVLFTCDACTPRGR